MRVELSRIAEKYCSGFLQFRRSWRSGERNRRIIDVATTNGSAGTSNSFVYAVAYVDIFSVKRRLCRFLLTMATLWKKWIIFFSIPKYFSVQLYWTCNMIILWSLRTRLGLSIQKNTLVSEQKDDLGILTFGQICSHSESWKSNFTKSKKGCFLRFLKLFISFTQLVDRLKMCTHRCQYTPQQPLAEMRRILASLHKAFKVLVDKMITKEIKVNNW